MVAEFTDLLALTDKYKPQAVQLDLKARADVRDAYNEALVEFLQILTKIIQRNNSSTVEEILHRSDVETAFAKALDKTRISVVKIVEKAFADGALVGNEQAKEEAALLGVDIKEGSVGVSPYLKALIKDVREQSYDMEKRAFDAFQTLYESSRFEDDPKQTTQQRREMSIRRSRWVAESVIKALGPVASRSNASASVAVQRGMTEGHAQAYAAVGKEWKLSKVWVANFSDTTKPPCPTCTALHGTEVPLNGKFSATQSYATPPKVYLDLYGPPRHPHCRCVLLITALKKEDTAYKGKDSPAGLRSFAQKQSKKVVNAFFGISSQQIKDLPQKKFFEFRDTILNTVRKAFSWRKSDG